MSEQDITVTCIRNGVTYERIRQERAVCSECAACGKPELCRSLPPCSDEYGFSKWVATSPAPSPATINADLLAACKALLDAPACEVDCDREGPDASEVWKQLTAAIAKAEPK